MNNTETNTTLVMLPQSELESLKKELNEIKELIIQSKEEAFRNRWVESEDARKQFGVCSKTWQTMRDKRVIPFTQFGRKIYFKQADIEAFLEKHAVK